MGMDYRLSFDPPGSIGSLGAESWGETDHTLRTIRVEDNLPHDKERAVVTHEMLHQMIAASGMALPDKVEETICTFLGDALIGHMRDNPALWRYLLKKPAKETHE